MMWDERYSTKEYIYGTEPNSFLKAYAKDLAGPVLSIAEGEGRNAVFLASLGLQVLGVDCSGVGLEKAKELAKTHGVSIDTEVADLGDFFPKENTYGTVTSIFAHLPSDLRAHLYPLLEKSLKPGGLLVLEAYTEEQLNNDTGGPKNADMLMSLDKLRSEFPNLEIIELRKLERDVIEGSYHSGLASVVQFIGQKRA